MSMMTAASDAEVIAESKRNPDVFSLLYHRYAGQLFRYAVLRVGPDLAEDIVANAFVAAFRARDTYDTASESARPWLYAIVSRELAQYHRKEKSRYRALARTSYHPSDEPFADLVDNDVSVRALRRQLANALAQLSSPDRAVLLLVAWGDLRYDEVAQSLGIPIGTVRSRLNRARTKLRAVLSSEIIEVLT